MCMCTCVFKNIFPTWKCGRGRVSGVGIRGSAWRVSAGAAFITSALYDAARITVGFSARKPGQRVIRPRFRTRRNVRRRSVRPSSSVVAL